MTVAFGSTCSHGVAEYLPCCLLGPVGCFNGSTALDTSKRCQELRGCNIANRMTADHRKQVFFQCPHGAVLVSLGFVSHLPGEPFQGYGLKAIACCFALVGFLGPLHIAGIYPIAQ